MNKIELIQALHEEADITQKEADEIVRLFFDSMADSLAMEDRVEIRGLWSFYVKQYESYKGRNPKTGKKIVIKPKKLPYFKCSRALKDRVDDFAD